LELAAFALELVRVQLGQLPIAHILIYTVLTAITTLAVHARSIL